MLIRLTALLSFTILAANVTGNATAGTEDPLRNEARSPASDAATSPKSSSRQRQAQPEPESPAHRWRFNVAPRIAFRQSTAGASAVTPESSNFQRITLDLTTSTEAGATVAVSPPGWSRTDLVATVMSVPSSTGSFETLVLSPLPFIAVGTFEARRLDTEVLIRRHIRETRAYWLAGFEHIRLDSERRGPSIFQLLDSDSVRRSYFGKAGLGGSLDLSSSGRHQLFTDLLVAFGWRTETTNFLTLALEQNDRSASLGFDVGAGYRFLLTKGVSLGVRYRIQGATIATGAAGGGSDLQLLHGVELHASVPF